MPHVEASNGIEVLNQLTENDSWIKTTYFLVMEASRQFDNPLFKRNFAEAGSINAAGKLQRDIMAVIPHDGEQARDIKPGKVRALSDFIEMNNGGLIIMRHGRQFIEDEQRKLLTGSMRKINLMQLPFNDEDPADAQSLSEAAGLSIALKSILRDFELPIRMISSRNARAADIAAVICVANNADIQIDDRLTCVNYPSDIPAEQLVRLIGENNNGALTWNKEIIDPVCGEGTFDKITSDVSELIAETSNFTGLTVCITHTPQMNAADLIASNSPVRVPELGFRIFGRNQSLQFPNSIFED